MTPTNTEALAAELEKQRVSNWVHSTGAPPIICGTKLDPLCQQAAAELRRLAAVEAQDSARTSPAHQPVHGWTDADADAARLALELECLLTDGDVPMPVTSRWWESAHEALALHRQRLESGRAAMLAAAKGVME